MSVYIWSVYIYHSSFYYFISSSVLVVFWRFSFLQGLDSCLLNKVNKPTLLLIHSPNYFLMAVQKIRLP